MRHSLQLTALLFVLFPARPPVRPVVRYPCIVTRLHGEILCFQPDDGRMFRPERRFDSFIVEVPSL